MALYREQRAGPPGTLGSESWQLPALGGGAGHGHGLLRQREGKGPLLLTAVVEMLKNEELFF